jgi:hypothetical protein
MNKLRALLPPLPYLILLPAVMIPRVVVHDLRLLPLDSTLYVLLALVPLGVWAFVAATRRTEHPVREFLIYGAAYGLLLGLTHQVLWAAAFGDNLPRIGGNLAGKLDPFWEQVLLRKFALISSIGTGLVTGALFGVAAVFAQKLRTLGKS